MKNNSKRIFAALLCLVMLLGMLPAAAMALAPPPPTVVACVGDSITYGHNPASPSGMPRILEKNWVSLLAKELGGWEVQNYGVSGTTVMKDGDLPYWEEPEFEQSILAKPDIVIIMLGTNDSKPSNWEKKEQFADDLKALIAEYQNLSTKPTVYVATSATAYDDGAFDIVPSVVNDEIVAIQKQVAREMGCKVIDINAATADMPENFPDNIHPNVAGHAAIFEAMYEALTAKIKVACIGDSITYGHNPASPMGYPRITENWPKILGDFLGTGYDVRNFGRNGTTLSKNGQISVWNSQEFADSKSFEPDIVIIMLGTNDYAHTATYADTLKELIGVYRDLTFIPEVYIATCAMPYEPGAFGIQCGPIKDSIVPQQKAVAEEMGCKLIDIHAATADMPENFPDNIHPNEAGHRVIATAMLMGLRNCSHGFYMHDIVTEPTCEEGGYTLHKCFACGYFYTDAETEALGHDYREVVIEPTCFTSGYTTQRCSRCGDRLSDLENVVPPLEHKWDEGMITKEPTEAWDGVMVYTCSICGGTKSEAIPKLPISPEHEAAMKAAEAAEASVVAAKKAAAEAQAKAEEAAAVAKESEEAYRAQEAANDAMEAAEKAVEAAKIAADAAAEGDVAAAEAAAAVADAQARLADALMEIAFQMAERAKKKDNEEEPSFPVEPVDPLYMARIRALGQYYDALMEAGIAFVGDEAIEAGVKAIEEATTVEAVEAALKAALEAIPGYCPSGDFTDVPAFGSWAHEGIDYCVRNGLMKGVDGNIFSPKGTLTRAELVTILYRAAGEPEVEFKGVFSDVPDNLWYSDAIEWAAANKIVNGIREGVFDPAGIITREQIATILYRYADEPIAVGGLSSFPDAGTVRAYARGAMIWATSKGVINGASRNGVAYLAPEAEATREQIASVVMRFLELEEKQPIPAWK